MISSNGVKTQTAPQSGTLKLNITGLRNSKGKIGWMLYNSAENFPKEGKPPYKSGTIHLSKNTTVIEISNLPFGTYAVAILHDENDNGKMDKNFFGLPEEGFGFSNNPTIGMSAPKFSDCSFSFKASGYSVGIKAKYM
ncbi:MAG: DUF2141 domain-containing protein [Bacteroidetes bacterium]|nr:DUF2141 domain-containing protein [Bacteroidota bacterium]